jgi:sarcosine oxidase/L-pipecolate oxidase
MRMFRTAYTEDFMADLAKLSMNDWDDLEAAVGQTNETPDTKKLRLMSGLLNFGDRKSRSAMLINQLRSC